MKLQGANLMDLCAELIIRLETTRGQTGNTCEKEVRAILHECGYDADDVYERVGKKKLGAQK